MAADEAAWRRLHDVAKLHYYFNHDLEGLVRAEEKLAEGLAAICKLKTTHKANSVMMQEIAVKEVSSLQLRQVIEATGSLCHQQTHCISTSVFGIHTHW